MPRTIRNEFDKKLTFENLMKAKVESINFMPYFYN